MLIDLNFELLESNMCPQCMAPFIKHGTGYDRGIHCGGCGYETPIEKYREAMRKLASKKFIPNQEED